MKKIILLVITAIFLTSCSNLKAQNNLITKNYNIDNIENLYIHIKNSKIEAQSSDSDKITLEITTNEKLKIKEDKDGKNLYITVIYPRKSFLDFFENNSKTKSVILVPKNFNKNLFLMTSNGSISAKNLKLNLDVKTSNGRIILSNINGQVGASTSNGRISLFNINGQVNTSTSNGSITAKKIKEINSISTSNGNIFIESNILKKHGNITTSNGGITLKINKLEGNNDIKTSNGKIVLITEKQQFNFTEFSSSKLRDYDKNIYLRGRKIKIITLK